LHFSRAAQGVDDAGELDQEAVASRFDDAAVMFCNFRVDHLGADGLQPAERPFLVGSDQARIPRHIGRQDRRQPTFDTTTPRRLHGSSPDGANLTPA
jgi:hypothetical protein